MNIIPQPMSFSGIHDRPKTLLRLSAGCIFFPHRHLK